MPAGVILSTSATNPLLHIYNPREERKGKEKSEQEMEREDDGLRAGLLRISLDLSRLGTSNMVGRDPLSVVGGATNVRAGSCSWLSLLNCLDAGRLGGSGLALLGGEIGGDPDGVEEVEGSGKERAEEEVEEEASCDSGQSNHVP